MSNYPPPQYGMSYNPSGHMAPLPGTYSTESSQYIYHNQTQPAYLHGPGPSNGVSPTPYANVQSFNVNGQGITPPGNGVNQGFPGYNTQPFHNVLPPPPFPPVRIPFGTSHSHQASSQNLTKATVPLAQGYLPSESSEAPLQEKSRTALTEHPEGAILPTSDLEDGELDDEESDSSSNLTESNAMGVNLSRAPAQGPNEENGLTGKNVLNGSNNNTHEISPGQLQGDYFYPSSHKSNVFSPRRELILPDALSDSDNQLPITSHDQQPLPQTGYDNVSTSSLSVGGTSGANLPTSDAVEVHASKNTKPIAEKKRDARKALLDLHSHGHDFNDIVGRGMDPAFLRTLYTDVGIPIDSSPSSQLQRELEVNARRASAIDPGATNKEAQPEVANLEPSTTSNGASGLTKTSMVVTIEKEKEPVVSLATTAAPKKASTNTPSGKTSGSRAADSKPLDRKEYIARMLAAKAGKPVPSISSSVALKESSVAALGPPVRSPTISAALVSSLSVATPVAPAIDQPPQDDMSMGLPQSLKDNQDIDAKRKAQTELARQKMEALKSRQENAKLISSSEPADQIHVSSSTNTPQPPVAAPMMTSQPPAPSRQASYLSPASQKAPFSIPGLFMTAPLNPVKPPKGGSNQSFTASAPGQQERYVPTAALHQTPTVTDAAPISQPIADAGNKAIRTDTAGPALTHRKRQKAADFLDPPSTRTKRPLGQQEDSSVIIDISDEDMADSSDDDSSSVYLTDTRISASKDSETKDIRGDKQKSIGDLPPLSDFPSQKKAPSMTSLTMPTTSQTKDSKGLRSKEMEIELMNRKIAELEQRISTKKTTSRAITPKNFGDTTASPTPKDPSRDVEALSEATEVLEAAIGHENDGYTRQLSLPTADNADTVEAEKRLHEVERAKASVERSLAADLAQASNEQQMQPKEILQRTQDHAQPTVQGESQPVDESGDARQQQVEQQQVEIQRHGGIQDDLTSRLVQEDSQSREQAETQPHQAEQTSLQAKEQPELLEEQRQERKRALESGLPVLDMTVEKTRQKLESMRKEIADLEMQVQKGMEGRKALVEELKGLSQAPDAPPDVHELHRPNILNHAEQSSGKTESQAATLPPSYREIIDDFKGPDSKDTEKAGTLQEPTTTVQSENASASALPLQAATHADEQLSDGELQESIMDISRSEIDEGELSEYRPKIPDAKVNHTDNHEDKEGYEPASKNGVIQRHPTQDSDPINGEVVEIDMPDADPESLLTNEPGAGLPLSIDELDHNADLQDEGQLSHPDLSLADDSDPDDYEPPEPALSPKLPVNESKTSTSSPPYVDVNRNIALVQPETQPVVEDINAIAKTIVPTPHEGIVPTRTHTSRQFIPYESPLKQFKSYRNHPQYLNEVSQGFRSLTYSHTINPDLPICRYELGGICNDASCQSQHFKSLGLSDEKILVDLGTLPRDADANAYTDGLKLLVQDIRSRKIKDVNKVASEITAYRRRFLGETQIISM